MVDPKPPFPFLTAGVVKCGITDTVCVSADALWSWCRSQHGFAECHSHQPAVLGDGKHRKAFSFEADLYQFNVSELLSLKGKTLRQPGPGVCGLHKAGALSGLLQLPQSGLPSLRAVFRRAEGTCVCLLVPGTSPATSSLKHTPDAAELLQNWCGPSTWHGIWSKPFGIFSFKKSRL